MIFAPYGLERYSIAVRCMFIGTVENNFSREAIKLVVGNKADASLDVLRQELAHLLHAGLLQVVELSQRKEFGNTVGAENHPAAEVRQAVDKGAFHVGALNDVLLSALGKKDALGHARGGVGHGEGGRAGTSLGLDDFGSRVLNTGGHGGRVRHGHGGSGLRQERKDGSSGVSTDDRYVDVGDVQAALLGDKGVCADNIERGNTHDLPRVVASSLLHDLSGNRDSRVDWVGNDVDDGVRAVRSDALDKALDDTGVDVEEIVAGHARLSRNSSRDNDKVGTGQGGTERLRSLVRRDLARGIDVREIGGDSRGDVGQIVHCKALNHRVHLEQQGEWPVQQRAE